MPLTPWFPLALTALVFLTKRPSGGSSNPVARNLIPLSCNALFPLRRPKWPPSLPPPAPPSLPPCSSFQPGTRSANSAANQCAHRHCPKHSVSELQADFLVSSSADCLPKPVSRRPLNLISLIRG